MHFPLNAGERTLSINLAKYMFPTQMLSSGLVPAPDHHWLPLASAMPRMASHGSEPGDLSSILGFLFCDSNVLQWI